MPESTPPDASGKGKGKGKGKKSKSKPKSVATTPNPTFAPDQQQLGVFVVCLFFGEAPFQSRTVTERLTFLLSRIGIDESIPTFEELYWQILTAAKPYQASAQSSQEAKPEQRVFCLRSTRRTMYAYMLNPRTLRGLVDMLADDDNPIASEQGGTDKEPAEYPIEEGPVEEDSVEIGTDLEDGGVQDARDSPASPFSRAIKANTIQSRPRLDGADDARDSHGSEPPEHPRGSKQSMAESGPELKQAFDDFTSFVPTPAKPTVPQSFADAYEDPFLLSLNSPVYSSNKDSLDNYFPGRIASSSLQLLPLTRPGMSPNDHHKTAAQLSGIEGIGFNTASFELEKVSQSSSVEQQPAIVPPMADIRRVTTALKRPYMAKVEVVSDTDSPTTEEHGTSRPTKTPRISLSSCWTTVPPSDYERLKGGQWLNDAIVHVFCEVAACSLPNTFTVDPLTIPIGCPDSVPNVNFLALHHIFAVQLGPNSSHTTISEGSTSRRFPRLMGIVQSDQHWVAFDVLVAAGDLKDPSVLTLYDSLAPMQEGQQHFPTVRKGIRTKVVALIREVIPVGLNEIDRPGFWVVKAGTCPQQTNHDDCGVYAIIALLRLAAGVDVNKPVGIKDTHDATKEGIMWWRFVLRALIEKKPLQAISAAACAINPRINNDGEMQLHEEGGTHVGPRQLLQVNPDGFIHAHLCAAMAIAETASQTYADRAINIGASADLLEHIQNLLTTIEFNTREALTEAQSAATHAQQQQQNIFNAMSAMQRYTLGPEIIAWPAGQNALVSPAVEATDFLRARLSEAGKVSKHARLRVDAQEATLVRLGLLDIATVVGMLRKAAQEYWQLQEDKDKVVGQIRTLQVALGH